MNVREQIINFLLQANDGKDAVIAELQKQIADLKKQYGVVDAPPEISVKK
jgi:hypothetical protein